MKSYALAGPVEYLLYKCPHRKNPRVLDLVILGATQLFDLLLGAFLKRMGWSRIAIIISRSGSHCFYVKLGIFDINRIGKIVELLTM